MQYPYYLYILIPYRTSYLVESSHLHLLEPSRCCIFLWKAAIPQWRDMARPRSQMFDSNLRAALWGCRAFGLVLSLQWQFDKDGTLICTFTLSNVSEVGEKILPIMQASFSAHIKGCGLRVESVWNIFKFMSGATFVSISFRIRPGSWSWRFVSYWASCMVQWLLNLGTLLSSRDKMKYDK